MVDAAAKRFVVVTKSMKAFQNTAGFGGNVWFPISSFLRYTLSVDCLLMVFVSCCTQGVVFLEHGVMAYQLLVFQF
jgi:hypothetical protein